MQGHGQVLPPVKVVAENPSSGFAPPNARFTVLGLGFGMMENQMEKRMDRKWKLLFRVYGLYKSEG